MEVSVLVDDLGGLLGHLVVTLHDVESLAAEFTYHSVGTGLVGFRIQDDCVHSGELLTDR